MPTPIHVVRGASTALYPFVQTYMAQTSISDGQNGAATRTVRGAPLVHFDFPYDPVSQTEKNALKSAFSSAKGQFDATLSATTDIEYDFLSFDADDFVAVEQRATRYGVRWSVTQSVPQDLSPGASGSAFPTFQSGLSMGVRPFTQKKRFQTISSKADGGAKWTYPEFAGILSNFPSDGLMAWEFGGSGFTDAETATIVAHWLANWGDAFGFDFVDEDGTTYHKVHYATPELVIERQQANFCVVHIALVQTF